MASVTDRQDGLGLAVKRHEDFRDKVLKVLDWVIGEAEGVEEGSDPASLAYRLGEILGYAQCAKTVLFPDEE